MSQHNGPRPASAIVLLAVGIAAGDPVDPRRTEKQIDKARDALLNAGFAMVPYGSTDWQQIVARAATQMDFNDDIEEIS